MKSPSKEQLEQVVELLGSENIDETQIESEINEIAGDSMFARRLIDWTPEAFGAVAVAHMGRVIFTNEFTARTSDGRSIGFPVSAEPIYGLALAMAQERFHGGWDATCERVVDRSSVFQSAAALLKAGGSLDGAVSSGPALIGIPAEIYPIPPRSIVWKLLSILHKAGLICRKKRS